MKTRSILLVVALAIYVSCWGMLFKAAVDMKHEVERVTGEYTAHCGK